MSTSRLQQQTSALLSVHLGQYTIRENHRPAWLEGLELDFYIEELQVGIEVQGQQHFEYVPHFHSNYADFLALRDRDERKADLCLRHDVVLCHIETARDILPLIERLARIQLPSVDHPRYVARELEWALEQPEIARCIYRIRQQRELANDPRPHVRESGVRALVNCIIRLRRQLYNRFDDEIIEAVIQNV